MMCHGGMGVATEWMMLLHKEIVSEVANVRFSVLANYLSNINKTFP